MQFRAFVFTIDLLANQNGELEYYKAKIQTFCILLRSGTQGTHTALNTAASFPAPRGGDEKLILDPKLWRSSILALHKQSDISAEESCTYPGSRWLGATALSGPAPRHTAWYISAPGTSEEPWNSGKRARNVSEKAWGCARDHVTRPWDALLAFIDWCADYLTADLLM